MARAPKGPRKPSLTDKGVSKYGINGDYIRCVCANTEQNPKSRQLQAMIQCEDCNVWQHNRCVDVSTKAAELAQITYFCEQCAPDPLASEEEVTDMGREALEGEIWDIVMDAPVDRFWSLHGLVTSGRPKPGLDASNTDMLKTDEMKQQNKEKQTSEGADDTKKDAEQGGPLTPKSNRARSIQQDTKPTDQNRYTYNRDVDADLQVIFQASSNARLRRIHESLWSVKGNERNTRNHLRDEVEELIAEGSLETERITVLQEVFQWQTQTESISN